MDKSFLVIFNGEPFTHSLGTEISVVVTNWMGMLLTSTGGRPGMLHDKLQSINNPLKKTWPGTRDTPLISALERQAESSGTVSKI